MRARCPGSSANLGPGFDVLGLALSLYIEVEVRPAERLSIETSGEGSEFARDASHLGAKTAISVLGHDRFALRVHSEIPVSRGLGSSAALVVAAAAAAGSPNPLGFAAKSDGHGENAAASVLGGLVAAAMIDGVAVARPLPLDESLAFVAVVPDRELSTELARAALSSEVPFVDAVHNLGRLGLLIAGLGDVKGLIRAAGEDRLHEGARTSLFPESVELLARLREAGATISCWSGAGPTLLGICASKALAEAVRDAGEEALRETGVGGRSLVLEADRSGLQVFD